MKETIKLEIPKKSEFISIIRLTTSFVANNVGFNVEEIDDLKVVVFQIQLILEVFMELIYSLFRTMMIMNSFMIEVKI